MKKPIVDGYGLRLREERKRLGFTQVKFAELAGVKRVSQYLYENEESSPTLRYLIAASKNDVDITYILFNERTQNETISLNPKLLRDIYIMVDELCRDEEGCPQPVDARLKIFSMLCATNSGREDTSLNVGMLKYMLENQKETEE